MTKAEFKKRWESDETGGGITFADIADCYTAWGLGTQPKCKEMSEVCAAVLTAANVKEEE